MPKKELTKAEIAEMDRGPYTQFWDMHSGGDQKEDWSQIFIQAPEEEAIAVFYSRFKHNPRRVTCTCCGQDYSVSEGDTLSQLTGYHRDCEWDEKAGGYIEKDSTKYLKYGGGVKKHIPFKQFLKNFKLNGTLEKGAAALVIFAKDIKPNERLACVPEQGYVWQD